MGIEKEGSKSGGYVGGFFQLFDWKAKSRKKLFSSQSDLPDRPKQDCPKQGKRSDGNLPMTRFHMIEEDDTSPGLNIRGYSDYSCASSITDDEGYGARAPGVVARLMGLNSMPTSSFSDANSTPFFDTQSLRDVSQRRKHFDYHRDDQMMCTENILGMQDGPPMRKVLNRPIEKFQTEILPPKSAKSIPLTHHKLLSPIKSPGFIPSKTAAHIMEAAAKMIESSPQPVPKAKMPSVGSSSVPLKVWDLKEKLENAQKVPLAASSSAPFRVPDVKVPGEPASRTYRNAEASRRPTEPHAAKHLKGQSFQKSWNGPAETTASFRTYTETEESYSKGNGRSISLAVQAKVNVQRREGLNLSSTGGLIEQKEAVGEISSQPFKSQPNPHKCLHRKHVHSNSAGVLRPNHQKQNSVMDREKLSSKPSTSNLQSRKAPSGTPGRQKSYSKTIGPRIGSRKMALELADGEKGISPYSMRNAPRKKRLIDGRIPLDKAQPVNNLLIDSSQRAIESNPDRTFGWAEESKKKGMDVVSFTFTAPLTRSIATPGRTPHRNFCSSAEGRGKRMLLDSESMKLSSVGYNVIGENALSDLLEQKLKELNSSIASSHNRAIAGPAASSTSFSQESMHTETSREINPYDRSNQAIHQTGKSDDNSDSGLFSSGKTEFRWGTRFQGTDPMDECNSNCRRPSPVSVLDNSFSTASSSSFDSNDSSWTEGSKLCSSIQSREIFGFSSSKKCHYVDAEMDLSDSASSTSYNAIARKQAIPFGVTGSAGSTNWEVDYVAKILSNLELMFQDFSLGRTSEVINPRLFDQLEGRKYNSGACTVEGRLERKAIFDSVAECLDIRCSRYVGGGCKSWVAGVTMVRRKEWLAEEVHREISMWRGMGDCMVDELVDKDMSTQHGRWLDFEVDAFALGAELEGKIFGSLVDEVVADILFC